MQEFLKRSQGEPFDFEVNHDKPVSTVVPIAFTGGKHNIRVSDTLSGAPIHSTSYTYCAVRTLAYTFYPTAVARRKGH